MNILIIGSGAREHAIAKALAKSKLRPTLYCCGTANNPGIKDICVSYSIGDISNVERIVNCAKQWNIVLAIIGPELPLEKGVADALTDIGVAVVGPKKKLAQIETSKAFARELMSKHAIPGLPKYKVFNNLTGVSEFLHELGEKNYVVKANGLMSGKGVKVAGDHLHSISDAIEYCRELFNQKQSFVIEEKLVGQEFSVMCFYDGKTMVPMPIVQDFKRAYVDDKGPNTGGMGSYSAANHSLPFLTEADVQIAQEINQLVLQALSKECQDKYIGILYGGFIATAKGIYVIEFNARFGDPESLNVLTLLQTDFLEVCIAMSGGMLKPQNIHFANNSTVCKYAVPEGYPNTGLAHVEIDVHSVENKANLFLGSVHLKEGKLYATGSRTAAIVGVADSIIEAEQIAEQEIERIKGPLFHRKDIGTAELINKRVREMSQLRSE